MLTMMSPVPEKKMKWMKRMKRKTSWRNLERSSKTPKKKMILTTMRTRTRRTKRKNPMRITLLRMTLTS